MSGDDEKRARRSIRTLCAAITISLITVIASAASAGAADAVYVKSVPRQHGVTLRSLFDGELAAAKARGKPVVVVFTADWCTPCKALKLLLDDNPVVQRAAVAAHFLFIDVDDWRGPAHRLIPGANPSKLPMIARVDRAGALVKLCMGSELGLLSDLSAATNLTHLIRGEELEEPWYDADPTERMKLLREDTQKKRQRTEGVPAVEVEVIDSRPSPPPLLTQRFRVRLVLRNHDARRRWFAVSAPNDTLTEAPVARGYEVVTFSAHRRARYTRFDSDPDVFAFPMAGWGETKVDGWEVDAMPGDTVQVWELDRLLIDGKPAAFDKKVAYELEITNTTRRRTVAWRWADLELKLRPGKRHDFVLTSPGR